MGMKVIGIGNRIMRDDAIGVMIAESLEEAIEDLRVQVIIGETDVDYCLSFIDDGDFLFIIDATLYGLEPGTLTAQEINKEKIYAKEEYSQHQISLVKLMGICNVKNISGYILGIEVVDVDFGIELSDVITARFDDIKSKVYDFIKLGGVSNA